MGLRLWRCHLPGVCKFLSLFASSYALHLYTRVLATCYRARSDSCMTAWLSVPRTGIACMLTTRLRFVGTCRATPVLLLRLSRCHSFCCSWLPVMGFVVSETATPPVLVIRALLAAVKIIVASKYLACETPSRKTACEQHT